jgi:hypothetical protein
VPFFFGKVPDCWGFQLKLLFLITSLLEQNQHYVIQLENIRAELCRDVLTENLARERVSKVLSAKTTRFLLLELFYLAFSNYKLD